MNVLATPALNSFTDIGSLSFQDHVTSLHTRIMKLNDVWFDASGLANVKMYILSLKHLQQRGSG